MTKRVPNHHELPRYYLGGFAESGTSFVWVFDRGKPYRPGSKYGNNPRRTGLGKSGLRLDGYIAWHRDGQPHFHFERELQKREVPANDAIRRVRLFESITTEDKPILARYLALIWRRGGPQEQEIGAMVEREIRSTPFDMVARHFAERGQFTDARQVYDEKEWLASDKGRTERLREAILSDFPEVVALFISLRWTLLRAPAGAYFLSCDVPVAYDRTLGVRLSPVRFPLSSEVLLLCSWDGEGDLAWLPASEEDVRTANHAIISSAVRYVYSAYPDEWIQKALG